MCLSFAVAALHAEPGNIELPPFSTLSVVETLQGFDCIPLRRSGSTAREIHDQLG